MLSKFFLKWIISNMAANPNSNVLTTDSDGTCESKTQYWRHPVQYSRSKESFSNRKISDCFLCVFLVVFLFVC